MTLQEVLKLAKQLSPIDAERVINLSEQDAKTVFSLLENPPEPNENLKQAVEKHKAFFRKNH